MLRKHQPYRPPLTRVPADSSSFAGGNIRLTSSRFGQARDTSDRQPDLGVNATPDTKMLVPHHGGYMAHDEADR